MNPLMRRRVLLRLKNFNRRYTEAHSPQHKARNQMGERRSVLFPFRNAIPFRKYKLWMMVSLTSLFWGTYYITDARKERMKTNEQRTKLERRTLPFLQALEDIQWVAIDKRNDLVCQELFKDDLEEYQYLKKRFHQDDMWAPEAEWKIVYKHEGVPRSYIDSWVGVYNSAFSRSKRETEGI
mmetsp:Transcript_31467/g.35777  ORF Transcript_31467/g.35777 Transcript_31467/m.35777 type:complete len:181 (-) Transcript_31467:192-734(-)